MSNTSVLGDLPVDEFLDKYWQQRPLCVRQAFPQGRPKEQGQTTASISPDELAGLALEEAVESRLVMEREGSSPWALRLGPFTEADFSALPESHWTLLVQGLDLWVPQVAELSRHFDFLPAWRMDDVMASFATDGGSVGPHFDHYDVFLVQMQGQRRWQVGARCTPDTATLPDCDLDILAEFDAQQEWLLGPGDMLYLPPCVAHWGVALGDCMTFSVGFRAPTLADMLADLAVSVAASGRERYYTDPPLSAAMASAEIDPAFIQQAQSLLREALDDDELIADWFARFMTQPKYADLEDLTGELRTAQIGGVRYANGERVD